jgi:hypothetical protein
MLVLIIQLQCGFIVLEKLNNETKKMQLVEKKDFFFA